MNLDELNDNQKHVVLNTEGPMMVLAGAGSGKTKALTYKVAYLIKEKKIKPWEILAITFTNKAANEMNERIVKLSNTSENYFNIFTFHSFCARLLRNIAQYSGRTSSFSIYDESESLSVIKEIIKNKELDKEDFHPNNISHYIKRLKDFGHFPSQKKEEISKELDLFHDYYDIYIEYEKELIKSNAFDFGGLISSVIEILSNNEKVKKELTKKYKYILVDEFQDTNKAQFDLINLLINENKNLTVIGDDYQSIYRFRNADIKNFLSFDSFFSNVKFIKLEENYRSTKTIIKAANNVISNNKYQKEKNLYTNNENGNKINLYSCYDQSVEANIVGSKVSQWKRNGVQPSEIAILFRNNAQSRTIEEVFRTYNIPYILTGGMKFYERKEIKDFISLMRLIINPQDSYSLLRVINTPSRGIGKTTLDKLSSYSLDSSISLFDLLSNIPKEIKISKKAKEGISFFLNLIKTASSLYNTNKSLEELFIFLYEESGYKKNLEVSSKYEDKARIDNLKEFKGALKENDDKKISLVTFLENISLTIDQEDEEISKEDCVNLMTVHSSKGLEFEYVIILGLEENLFPSSQSLEEYDEIYGLEEERRLFYVAITRCKKDLSITACKKRFLYGKTVINKASRFLSEIPSELYEVVYK